jgi:hypothetical protein
MAFLYIDEYVTLPQLNSMNVIPQAPVAPPLATQRVAIGGASTASAAFNAGTKFILLHTDAICSIAFNAIGGADPTAVATAQRMNANETRFYGVYPGCKVAVITNT